MPTPRPQSSQPMPVDAQRVFMGKIFDVYQWEQVLFDGTKATFERLKRPDSTVVYPVLPDGRILLVKQQQPGRAEYFLGGPGGRVDPGEDPLDAAKRELLEETGYVAEHWELLTAVQPVTKLDWVVYYFIARDAQKQEEQTLDAGERIELTTVTFDELLLLAEDPAFNDVEISNKLLLARIHPEQNVALKKRFGINT